jgi:ABC-2 type transport system permease protein
MKTLYWMIKRELWEYRILTRWHYIALALTVVLLILNITPQMLSVVGFSQQNEAAFTSMKASTGSQPLPGFVVFITLFTFVLMLNYLSKCLTIERQDKSIQFFNSLPVSSLQVIASKLLMLFVVLPAIISIVIPLFALVNSGFESGLNMGSFTMTGIYVIDVWLAYLGLGFMLSIGVILEVSLVFAFSQWVKSPIFATFVCVIVLILLDVAMNGQLMKLYAQAKVVPVKAFIFLFVGDDSPMTITSGAIFMYAGQCILALFILWLAATFREYGTSSALFETFKQKLNKSA